MNIQDNLLLCNIGISIFVTAVALRRFKLTSTISLASLSLVVFFWNVVHLLFNLQTVHVSGLLFTAVVYLCNSIAGSALLAFSLIYSNRKSWIRWETIILLSIEPLATQILLWGNSTRGLFFLDPAASIYFLPNSGTWATANSLYVYSLEITSLILLTDLFSKKPRILLSQSGILLAAVSIPFIIRTLEMVNGSVFWFPDFSNTGYTLTIIGLAVALSRSDIVEIEPITCDTVVKVMNDGWMVLDLKNNIVDVNPAAEKIVGLPRHKLYGKPISSVLPDWPNITQPSGEGKELEMRRSVRASGTWRYLNIRISTLWEPSGNPFGKLIIWRDTTERKLAEEARQRARDEMFVLLNAISNAASHSIKLDDFLSESVYQLIYPFQSQMIAIFLINEYENIQQNEKYQLVAHFGLTPEDQSVLDNDLNLNSLFEKVLITRQPLIIDIPNEDSRLPTVVKQMANLVLLPLYTQTGDTSRSLGMMLFGRNNSFSYSQDEVIRLSTIAEQISNLIDSDRRRQLAIALSEREKLMRDLHDSVSQKLYGLVTLTEAAQAGLEAGSNVVPSQVLAKIGENARQAVKEMRLFLYQMQPVDLEEGDLISALHHRLGSVEGRADIQARFLPDEGISISKDKEVALYYIAQEALNNTLKHARANLVMVKLRQTRKNIILQVTDNGEGFNLKNVDHNGLGLQNMKARTEQINGKLKITSKPGAGTSIRVTVSRDKNSNRSLRR